MKNEFRKVRLLSQCQVAGRAGFQPRLCCCSVTKSRLTLWDPMDFSTPGFPVLPKLLELAQTHIHRVSDAIQPSHPLSSPSPPAFSLSHRIFSSGSALQIRWPKDWSFSISPTNEYSRLISLKMDWFDLLAVSHGYPLFGVFLCLLFICLSSSSSCPPRRKTGKILFF